jgi:hypothetical protein
LYQTSLFNLSRENHMKKYQIQSVLLLALNLASYSEAADFSSPEFLGKSNAKSMIAEVHNAYLHCYPLNASAKNACLKELALKYISEKQKINSEYVRAFQFEAEKLGFKHFLNDLKLPCEQVNGGPEFIEAKKAYLVKCVPNHQYHMQFDYKDKKWIILKEKTER